MYIFEKKCITFTSVHELLNRSFYWLLCLLHTNMSSLSLGMVSAQKAIVSMASYSFLYIEQSFYLYTFSSIIVDGIEIFNYGNFMQMSVICLTGLCPLHLRYLKDIENLTSQTKETSALTCLPHPLLLYLLVIISTFL